VMFDYGGPSAPYWTTAALMLLAAYVGLSLPRRVSATAQAETELKAG